jgi:hypothetical protein
MTKAPEYAINTCTFVRSLWLQNVTISFDLMTIRSPDQHASLPRMLPCLKTLFPEEAPEAEEMHQ